MSKTRKENLNPVSLASDTISIWQIRFWRIIFLCAIVAIPGSLLGVVEIDSVTNASIITTIAGMYLYVALSWSFLFEKDLMKLRLGQLYIKSSGRVLPYLATSIIFSIIAMPSLLAVFVITLGFAEQIPVGFIFFGLAVAVTCLYFMLRFSLATVLVVQNEISSIQALRLSWQITSGYLIKLLIAWSVLIAAVVVVSGVILWLIGLVAFMRNNVYAVALSNGVLLTFVLPFFIGYSVQITRRLEK